MSDNDNLPTYEEAMRLLKDDQRRKLSNIRHWDAGDGFIGRGFWCPWRKRIVTCVVTPEGYVII